LHRLPHQGVVNDDVRAYDTHRGAPGLAHPLLIGSAPGRPMVGGRVRVIRASQLGRWLRAAPHRTNGAGP
jgi:hypothetical protein